MITIQSNPTMLTPTQFMKKSILSATLLLTFVGLFANSSYLIKDTLNWTSGKKLDNPLSSTPIAYFHFEGASYKADHLSLPYYTTQVKLPGSGVIGYQFKETVFEPLDNITAEEEKFLDEEIKVNTFVEKGKRTYSGRITFIPIRKKGNTYEKLVAFEIEISYRPTLGTASPRTDWTYTSELNDGEIYKIAVTNDGIHKIDYTFLKESLQIDIDNIDPRTIKLLGNFGGPLPLKVGDFRYDDLEENAIWINGEEDGSFDTNDYLLFYANGPHRWEYNESKSRFDRLTNVFDDKKYYFLKISPGNGKRIGQQNSIADASAETTSFDDYRRFEEDNINLLFDMSGAQGSGRDWYGDQFNQIREKSYSFSFPNLDTNEPIQLNSEFIARHNVSTTYYLTANNSQQFQSTTISNVALDKVDGYFARSGSIETTFLSNGDGITIDLQYPGVGDQTNQGWLDYIQLNARRRLVMTSDPLVFRDTRTLNNTATTFKISNADNTIEIWDISNSQNPKRQEATLNGSTLSFGVNTETLKEFIAFRLSNNFSAPEAVGQIDNQNIHATDGVQMVIIYHPDFEAQAIQLADHRSQHSGINVATIQVDHIWNEFSSGGLDPTAIRDFMRMCYNRNSDFNYLLLLGDASFDYKNIYQGGGNFVPTFETIESLSALTGYPTDDYYSFLDEDEGASLSIGKRDIAVGRIPARNAAEAQIVVNKIIHYDENPITMGDWRNRLVFVADDEDNNVHLNDTDELAVKTQLDEPNFNESKIYLDAFAQESTPGGARIPQAQEALNRDMFKGALAVNYLGHGGSSGWAQERVLRQSDILSWDNYNKLPLFVTATCSFAGFDEPGLTTGGELALLREGGGAIALFTTVRAVFAQQNKRLTESVLEFLFGTSPTTADLPPIGEILRLSKNNTDAGASNTLKFTLLGDPSMDLAVPMEKVVSTTINGQPFGSMTDTIKALQKVTITGMVTDHSGQILSDFNGTVYPTVFDKATTVTTLGQDEKSFPVEFTVQNSVLFKGKATVSNGLFEFSFVVPQDIDYDFGQGKISYYAENGKALDARGYTNDFIVGGSDLDGIEDDQGPLVEVFMNDDNFVSGGLTDENPDLFIKLSDDNGINVTGNSVGHDLTAILDGNTQSPYVLNDFYEAEKDDYKRGTVRFPIYDIAPGKHTVEVTAWDIANNFSTGSTEFFVASSEAAALEHVLNYPNPFTTHTNFQFEHNLNGLDIEVQVQIFTVSGKLVKTIVYNTLPEGNRITDVSWDGTDDYGDRLGKGVYVYKVKLNAPELESANIKAESDFERLVILK